MISKAAGNESQGSGGLPGTPRIRALSLDPGVTSGYCAAIVDDGYLYLAPAQAELTHARLYELLNYANPTHVICEDFEYRPGEARPALILTSKELIGVVKFFSERHGVPLYMQKASTGKGYYKDDKLKRLAIYKRGVPHGMDALRHFMHWFVLSAGRRLWDEAPKQQLVDINWLTERYF